MPRKGSRRVAILVEGAANLKFNVSARIGGYTKQGTPKVVEEYAVGSITCCAGEGSGTQRLIIAKTLGGDPITMDLEWGEGGLIMPTVRQINAELKRLGLKK